MIQSSTRVTIIERERNIIYIQRESYINAADQREFYINSILSWGDRHHVKQTRMEPIIFYHLCDLLTSQDLLRSNKNVSIREQMIVFLQIISQNPIFYFISGIYYRSNETIYRYFIIVLKTILKLYRHHIKDPNDIILIDIMDNWRFYPYFKVQEQY